jgi:P-type E1-E2 ATPase
MPLTGVVILTMVKEAIEDYKRHKADQLVNNSTAKIVDEKTRKSIDILWSEVQVGDVLELCDHEAVCADGILLSSCTNQGIAYIETSSLDG